MTTSDGKGGEVKMFPIQRSYNRGVPAYPMLIPWSVAELAYSVYASQNGTGQSLVRLGERGGFGPEEMDELLPGWRERCDTINTLSTTIAELRAQVEGLMDRVKCEAAEVDKGRDVGSVLNQWIPAIEQEFGGTQGTDAQPHTARLLMVMRQWHASRPATDAARLAAKGEK